MVDYSLANQSGAQFRAELNLILAALQSCGFDATPPAATTAGQLWVDASGASPVLRVRNALNAGWIALGTLAPGGFELAGVSEAGRALIGAATVAAQRAAMGLGAGALAAFATEAEAQAGTDNTTLMTPLRTRQATAGLGGLTLLGTLTTTSGTSQTLSGLDLTGFVALLILVHGVSHGSGSNQSLSIDGMQVSQARSAADAFQGRATVLLDSGWTEAVIGHAANSNASVYLQPTSLRRTSGSVTVSLSGGSFDAGVIRIHGVK